MDWHAEYVNLGRAAALCDCAPLDANYNASTHTFTPKIAVPRAYFTGEGRSQGVALTLVTASGSASRPVRTFTAIVGPIRSTTGRCPMPRDDAVAVGYLLVGGACSWCDCR
jgi:hypothetical protein